MTRQAWILLSTTILFGFVLLAYKNSDNDGKEAFSYELSVLDQLWHWNASIDREVLLLVSQKKVSYDGLTKTTNELVRINTLIASELFQDDVMDNQIVTKANAIESLKSRLSVLRNSVNAVVEDLTRTSEEDFDSTFRRLEESLLKLSFSLDSNVTNELEALILEGEKTGSVSDQIIYQHATLILESLRQVETLSQSIVNSEVSRSIYRNKAVSSERYAQQSAVAEAWRVTLFGAAIGLLCLLSLSVWMVLRRTFELRYLNRELEKRVEARTNSLQEIVSQKEEQEKLLRAILDSMDSHIAILNHKGDIIETNLAWENFAARNSGGASCTVGGNYLKSCERATGDCSDTAQYVKTAIEDIIAGKEPYKQIDYKCSTPELELWFQARISPIDFGSGSIGCVVSHMDITQRVLSEQESKLLSLVAKYTDNAVIITDARGRIRWVNEGYVRVTGYDLEASLGRKPGDLLQGPKTDLQTVQQMSDGIRSGKGFDVEVMNYSKNGDAYWVSIEARPIFDQQGKLSSFIAIEAEISQQKLMQEELQSERSLLEKILSTIPYNIYWKDKDSNFMGCNDAFAEQFNLKPGAIQGLTEFDLEWNQECAKDNRDEDAYVLSTGEARLNIEREYRRGNGQLAHLTVSRAPLLDGNGEVDGVISIAIDMTEQKQMEEQLANASKLESIGQLAAGIAHEINTPTQYVGDNTRFLETSFLELAPALDEAEKLVGLAKSQQLSQEQTKSLRIALEDADLEYLREEIPRAIKQSLEGIAHIGKIVQSMKEFSHPGTENVTPIDINHALRNTLTVATNEWKYVANVETGLDDSIPEILGFPGELNQVFLNIIVNACHAIADRNDENPGQKGLLRITSQSLEDCVEIRISDTGSGIPESAQGKIFEPFFTTKMVGKGTGQGLSIAYNIIVSKHKGHLSFETEPGKGTTFVIKLPKSWSTDSEDETGTESLAV